MGDAVRVLHLIKGLGPGGAERLLVSLAEAADPAAVSYEVAYLLPWKDHLVAALEAGGVRTHLLAGRRGFGDPRWPARLRGLLPWFDVVHLHSPAVAAVARVVVAPRKRGPLLVSTEHNVWSSHGRPTRLANALTQPLDRRAWAVSEEVRRSMPARRQAGVEVVLQGVPVDRLHERRAERPGARADRGWAPEDVVVVTVANLRANKDYPTLIRAASVALAEEPRLRFAAIGQGPLEAEVRAEVEQAGLGSRFELLGYHDDPPAVVAGADLFALSSRHEGLPIALLEAMALGVAPVVTAVGGNAEVVTDGVDGVLVPPADPDALAAALVDLARRPAAREALGAAAVVRSRAFDIARTARQLEAAYQDLVEEER